MSASPYTSVEFLKYVARSVVRCTPDVNVNHKMCSCMSNADLSKEMRNKKLIIKLMTA